MGAKRTALRSVGVAAGVWAVALALQWLTLYASVLHVSEGADSAFHCYGRQTSENCVSVWGPWSAAAYAPELILPLGLAAAALARGSHWRRLALLVAPAAYLVVLVAAAVTHGAFVGQAPLDLYPG